jgi:hypothetical protein
VPLLIGGGVAAVVVIGLLVFLGVRAFGGDDEPVVGPTPRVTHLGGSPSKSPGTEPTSEPSSVASAGPAPSGLGNATGQAKTATDKLQAAGFQCSDLFNTPQGAHRGCFKYAGATQAETVFQFLADGTIIGVLVRSDDSENVNNAAVTFDAALQAVGTDAFGGSEVAKIQAAVRTGQKTGKVGSTWGEFTLRNDGDALRLSGGKSGSDSLDLPRKEFETTEAALKAGLKAKGYECTSSCRKTIGGYGSQSIFGIGSDGGIRDLMIRASGEAKDVKASMPAATADAFAVVKGSDVAGLKAWLAAHADGRSYAGYVNGWRVEITGNGSGSFGSQSVDISYESFYV